MARSLEPWRRLLSLRTRLADGERLLLASAQQRLAELERIYESYAHRHGDRTGQHPGSQTTEAPWPQHDSERADELAAVGTARDATWQALQVETRAVLQQRAIWQRAKQEQRQAELLLERFVKEHKARESRQEIAGQEDWLRASSVTKEQDHREADGQ